MLLGIVLRSGRVAYASEEIHVDREFVDIAHQGRSPETRFRFAQPCARGGCREWTGSRCRVADDFPSASCATVPTAELPRCSIRPRCRWFIQAGAEACAACPEVITDNRLEPAGS